MTFATLPEPSFRLNRSQLAVPGSSRRFLEKAAGLQNVDVVLLDLEDAVAEDQKAEARKNVIEALSDLDWGEKSVSVRVNGMDTPHCYRDIVDVLEQAPDRLDLIMLPKTGTAEDVYAVDFLISQVEMARVRPQPVGLELQIETALGLANVEAIARSRPRVESLHLGPGDYMASIRGDSVDIGGPNPHYGVLTHPDSTDHRHFHWNDVWHYPMARIAVAARAAGIRPIDGPYADYQDEAGLAAAAARAKALGFDGKWAIHPSQIDTLNAAFTPSQANAAEAYAILDAMAHARAAGRGAVTLNGRMIDEASVRQAQAQIAQYEAAGGSRAQAGAA